MFYAAVAELADALDSGSSGHLTVQVQVLSSAEITDNPNPTDIRLIGKGFGFVLSFKNLLT